MDVFLWYNEIGSDSMGKFQNLEGMQSGSLIAKKYLGNSKWLCVCNECGNEVIITTNWFNKNKRLGRAGCKHVKEIQIGDIFGYLTVKGKANDYIKPKTGAHEKVWICECICGRKKEILDCNLKMNKSLSCGICMSRVSIPEKMIYFYLSKYFKDIQEQYRPKFLNGKEIDIYIPSLNIGIEYDGYRWHKDVNKDILKNKVCKQNGITLIRVRENKCPDIDMKHCIITPQPLTNGNHMTEPIKKLIKILNSEFDCNINVDVDCCRDNADISKKIFTTAGYSSLEYQYPEIAKEWDYERNNPLTPDKISAHSGKKAWWKCPKCNSSYSSVVASRTSQDRCGCPNCKHTKLFKKVLCVELCKEFESVNAAAEFINRKPCSITSSIKKGYKCAGYNWKYIK